MAAGSVNLIYVDPPFNTGGRQSRLQLKTVRSEQGDRVGFGGRRYRTSSSGAAGTRTASRTISHSCVQG